MELASWQRDCHESPTATSIGKEHSFMHRTNSQRAWLHSLIVTAFVSVIGLILVMPGSFSSWRVAAAPPTVVYKTYGMDFSPYVDGQDPNLGTQSTEAH